MAVSKTICGQPANSSIARHTPPHAQYFQLRVRIHFSMHQKTAGTHAAEFGMVTVTELQHKKPASAKVAEPIHTPKVEFTNSRRKRLVKKASRKTLKAMDRLKAVAGLNN